MSEIVTPDWVKDAIFYQIFPDTFARSTRVPKPGNLRDWNAPPNVHGYKGGDLIGVVEHLDYLTDLGVNALYLCPIFQSASNHRYHTHDYYQVDPMLGGTPAFRELLDRAHERNIRVVIDGVFNHASRGFFQFHDILENGVESAYVDWFTILDPKKPLVPYDPQAIASGRHTWPTNYLCWWDLPALPQFNIKNREVREFLWKVAAHWVDFGIDGWRLDVPECIDDPAFWQEFRRRVRTINPEAYLVGEIWHYAPQWLAGDRFDAVMNYVFNRAALCFFGGNKLDTRFTPGGFTLAPIDAETFALRIDEMLGTYDWQITQVQLNLLGSHDTPRALSILGGDRQSLEMCVLFQMTIPGAPCVYYGDEVGMTNVPVLGHESRATMSWNESRWDLGLRASFQRYITLRQTYPALRRGTFFSLYASNQQHVYAFGRQLDDQKMIVVFNNSTSPYEVHVPVKDQLADGVLLADCLDGGTYQVQQGHLVGTPIRPRSGIVLCVQ